MTAPTVAVVIPAFNAEATLPACLAAISAMTKPANELIVFSDGSADRTEAIAHAAGAMVIRNAGLPKGPAHGRNVAAAAAQSDLILFIDADVVIAPAALALLLSELVKQGADAAFGSYDDRPQSQRTASLYANLRHHFVHQHGNRDASTFWSGLGLIDRQVFLDLGGFDASFAHPSIEDIELGTRLIAAGRTIRLVPEAQAKHCKDWTLWRLWHTDIIRRAYPWSCLLIDRRMAGTDLNVSAAERARVIAALAILLLLIVSAVWPIALFGAAAACLIYLLLNRRFIALLASRLPPFTLAKAISLHWCYHVYAFGTYAIVMLQTGLRIRRPSPSQCKTAAPQESRFQAIQSTLNERQAAGKPSK